MDKNSAIIGAVLIALCAIPFILIYLNRRNKEKQMLADLSSFAAENNCSIGEFEICRDFIIGVDKNKNFAFFEKKGQSGNFKSAVNCSDMEKCRINKITRTVGENSASQTIIEKIELNFQPKQRDGKTISWPIFDVDEHMQVSGELICIEKWCNLIGKQLR